MGYNKKNDNVNETVSIVENKTETVKEKVKTFGQEDLIPCRSIISGALYIEGSRSKILYSWADVDDVVDVEYRDLIYMVRTREDKNIYEPRIIVQDDDFVAQNKSLSDFYESMHSIVNLREILEYPIRDMINAINKLPVGARNSLKGIASTMIDSHALDSVQKIKALDELFGTNMLLTLTQE